MKNIILTLIILILTSCAASKKISEDEAPKPEWLINRPSNVSYYTGIGIAKKWGSPDNYKSDARDKALADMASQINSKISTTSVLYQVEDKKGVSEILSNNIKSSSAEFLEGYEEVDSFEDNMYYYVYYKLSKLQFAQLKAERKDRAINNAYSKYIQANAEIKNNNTHSAMVFYTSALEAISTYLGEDNTKAFDDGNSIDVGIESIKQLKSLINELNIQSDIGTIDVNIGELISQDKLVFRVSDNNNIIQSNIPVKFKYSGGYLRKDNDNTNNEGFASTIIHQVTGNPIQTLCAEIDIVKLTRQLTTDLLIRKLIDNTDGKDACITINIR